MVNFSLLFTALTAVVLLLCTTLSGQLIISAIGHLDKESIDFLADKKFLIYLELIIVNSVYIGIILISYVFSCNKCILGK